MEKPTVTTLPKVTIRHIYETHDCECCGCYETDDVTILKDGEVLDLHFSGHFGNGNYNPYDKFEMVQKLGAFLGYDVEVIECPKQ